MSTTISLLVIFILLGVTVFLFWCGILLVKDLEDTRRELGECRRELGDLDWSNYEDVQGK